MGRRLNLSTPTVINTELIPLDESFYIEANGNTEQWYYDNTNVYAPNRNVIPLTLTPRLSVFDGDTKTTYTPTFFMVKWYAKEYNATQGEYVETQITTTDPAATDYVLSGNNLLVKKNVPYSHDVTIRCEATYVDPRDTGVTSTIQDTVTLLTNRDASTISPMLEIDCPASQGFNPLTATTSKYTLKGRASWGQDLANDNIVTFKADPLGTENIIPTNEDSVDSAAPTLSLRYGSINQADQTFMSRQTSGGQVGNIEGGVGYVTNIKGDTVAWNQMVRNGNFAAGVAYWNSARVTLTDDNGRGKCIITEISTSPVGCRVSQELLNSFITGHKYFISCEYDVPKATTVGFEYNAQGGVSINFNISSGKTKVASIVTSAISAAAQVFFGISGEGYSIGDTFYVDNIMIIDLTLMFGAGNEPATVAAFESWLATYIGTKSYYPYTEGRLINYGGYQVKMNQLVENGDFRDGVNSWETYNNNGTISVTNNECTYTITRLGSTMYDNTTNHVIDVVQGHKYYSSYEIYVTKQCSVNRGYYIGYGYMTTVNAGWNKMQALQTGDSTNTTKYRCGIANASQNGYQVGDYYKIKNLVIIDLTLMFGAGNEPDLNWCNAHFTEDYYPYHTGYDTNLLSVADEDLGIKTVGFNLWDEQWELGYYNTDGSKANSNNRIRCKNKINVKAGQMIYVNASTNNYELYIRFYNKSGGYITTQNIVNNICLIPENSDYILFYVVGISTYRNDICINISDPSKNGTYEPYWESFTDMSWISKIGIENFNVWDEEYVVGILENGVVTEGAGNRICSKNYIPVNPNTQYYHYSGNSSIGRYAYYDSNKQLVAYYAASIPVGTFTTPNNAYYMMFCMNEGYGTTYNHDICINKSIAHFNGRYYPHGETAPYFPNGLCNVGSVYDEIKVVDGKIKGVVRFGGVDLGNFSYTLIYSDTYHLFIQDNAIPNAKTAISGGINAASSRFENKGWAYIASYSSNNADDVLCLNDTSMGVNALVIRDTTYTDAATFKAAVAGVPLIYELQTPYEFEIDYPTKSLFEWYGISNDTEVKADTLPWYVDGQNTDTLTVDAMYGEEIRVVLRAKKNYGTDLYPSKAYRSILWRIPDIDSSVLSENGSAVRSDTESMNFGTIVNIKGDTLSDDVKKEHLRFHWRSRRDNTSTETDQGWGLTKELPASALINVKSSPSSRLASTIVYPEVYLLGAYEKVTDEGNDVTEDGELVYDRPVF